MSEKYTNVKAETKENSEVVITGEITTEAAINYRKKALREITESLTIPGFRKGHAPENVVVEKVGEAYILEETAEIGLKDIAPEVIEKHAPEYVGRPHIEITKLAPGNPIGFKITIGIMPKVKLPDYKKIAASEMSKKGEPAEVTEKEIDDVIEEIRKQRAHHAFHEATDSTASNTSGQASSPQAKSSQAHDHKPEEVEKHMPEFNDEFVKTLGNFSSVADFRAKAKENMTKEKEHRNIEKKRGALLEALIAKTDIKLPQAIIDSELERMFAQFEADITGMGLKVEDYLKHIKKTPEDLRKDWTPDAEKRAKLNLILAEVAKTEKIEPEKEAIEAEVKRLTEQFKDVDPVRVAAYVAHTLTIEKVIQFIEAQK